ncbi:hypothetical protein [Actinomadura alba]|uniref:Uncharacterized protein n=1 Tax=Actinomadura alba TaxID=406431 RepID=A0ABR7LZZ8_9ACTN|nr:hypothetical protein [Actinomadura alba]MBC6470325.1 hypothetical protein [Actinomadura alba]
MPDIENLDALSSGELHDRAVRLAVSRGDVKFLWDLLRDIPAAKAAAGDPRGGQDDILHVTALIRDFITAGEGEVAEGLRPVYLDYLSNTGD